MPRQPQASESAVNAAGNVNSCISLYCVVRPFGKMDQLNFSLINKERNGAQNETNERFEKGILICFVSIGLCIWISTRLLRSIGHERTISWIVDDLMWAIFSGGL